MIWEADHTAVLNISLPASYWQTPTDESYVATPTLNALFPKENVELIRRNCVKTQCKNKGRYACRQQMNCTEKFKCELDTIKCKNTLETNYVTLLYSLYDDQRYYKCVIQV